MSVHGQISNKFQVNQSKRLLITESRPDKVRFFWRYHNHYNKNLQLYRKQKHLSQNSITTKLEYIL